MKHVFAITVLLAGFSLPAAHAQSLEPRLAGGPQRVCTDEDIRQAMDGSFAGEPCRFREMPRGQTAPAGANAFAPPPSMQSPVRPVLAQTAAVPVTISSGARQGRGASEYSYYETSSDRHIRAAGAPVRYAEPARSETVSLGPEFFSGALVGGVETRLPPLYSYRRIILIDAAGGVQLAGSGASLVHVMDQQSRPPQLNRPAVRRAYPANY